jgi:CheY-like chemotaxis protein/HPt (histidine-containing phosphotransfer) domain-containing protein
MPASKKHCVLLVDDDEISRTITEAMLIDHGFTVFSHDNGRSAIISIENGLQCDIIVLDLLMPGMDGFSVATYIRGNLPQCDHVPLLSLSAESNPQHAGTNNRHLFDAHLTKPCDSAALLHTISRLLGHVPHSASSDASPEQTRHPWIDFALGLEHFSSSSKAYENVLGRFSPYMETFLSSFGTSLTNRDLDDCRRLAHGLKGSLRMIGASAAGDCAATLEQACTNSGDVKHVEERFETMEALLRAIDRAIRIKLLGNSASGTEPPH